MKFLAITENAAARVKAILSQSGDDSVNAVRVGVKNAGCAGMAYTLDYVSEPVKGDDHVSEHGVDVYIDPKATLFLLGTEMDYKEDILKSEFTFENPNQTGSCGCGESVMLEPADLQEIAKARASAGGNS
ncbi:HesB/IscA family protein [Maritalea sp.]|jgi:iron-sulfur cluster assembly protein|uniref:HesB/IscA family protein n=1 Tax=Maritalea sp. TaxID=2003361 RepID=UPI0039E5200B